MKYAVVNTEYERVLFKHIRGEAAQEDIDRVRRARQYLFYYINRDPQLGLSSHFELTSEVIDYFGKCGIILPYIKLNAVGENWYGLLKDIPMERKLNSKLNTYDLLRENNDLPRHFHVVSSSKEIYDVIKTNVVSSWILKSPFACGGAEVKIIQKNSDVPDNLKFPHILEPNLKRVLDVALYYDPITNISFPYICYIQPNGVYRGGRVYQNPLQMDLDLKEEGLYDSFYKCIERLNFYLEKIKRFDLKQPVTLDSFIYQEGGINRNYPMCEINYRISMGTLNYALRDFLPENGVGLLLVVDPKSNFEWREVMPYRRERKEGLISLSGGGTHLPEVLFLCAPSLKVLNRYRYIVFEHEKA